MSDIPARLLAASAVLLLYMAGVVLLHGPTEPGTALAVLR